MTNESAGTAGGAAAGSGARGGRPGREPRPVSVRRIESLTPRVTRVTFHGESLDGFQVRGPGAHIKIMFPLPGQDEPVMAPPGDDGRPQWSDEHPRPPVRTYTPRSYDPERHELAVEFVVHGADGPASAWATQVSEGQRVFVMGPGGGLEMPETAEWFVVLADEPAIPAACTLLEAVAPGTPVHAYLEVPGPGEERPLPGDDAVAVTWLHRGHGADDRAGERLEAALRDLDLPADAGHVWVACEADAMRRMRRHLIEERDLARESITTRGYWKLGATDHPDHDYGDDAAG